MKILTKIFAFLLIMGLMTSLAVINSNAEGKMIAYYSFDDASNLGKDSSGNGNDLFNVGKPQAEAGFLNGAVKFDGDCGLAAKEDAMGIDFTDNLGDFTIDLYAKYTGFVGVDSRVISSGYNGEQSGICLALGKYLNEGESHLVFQPIVSDRGSDHWGQLSETSQVTSEYVDDWHRYTATYNAKNRTVTSYIDGNKVAFYMVDDPVIKSTMDFCIGGSWANWHDPNHVQYGFEGLVDEVKIYNYELTDIAPAEGTDDSSESEEDPTDESSDEMASTEESDEPDASDNSSAVKDDENKGVSVTTTIIIAVAAAVICSLVAILAVVLILKKKNKDTKQD